MKETIEISGSLETGEMKVKGPWGEDEPSGMLGFIKTAKKQIQFYIDNDITPNPEAAKRDIEGYDIILNTGIEENAHNFLKLKAESRCGRDVAIRDNHHAIEILKERGLWRDKQ